MQFVAEDEPDLKLPEDSIHRARLEEIKLRTFTWTANDGTEREGRVLDWWWTITSSSLDPRYVGRKVKGQCDAKLSNREDNRFRTWAEVLLGRDVPVGMAIDTDDLVGLEAEVVIGHQKNKKDPSKVYEQVTDIAPISGAYDLNPPF